jgi:hypothetical protein
MEIHQRNIGALRAPLLWLLLSLSGLFPVLAAPVPSAKLKQWHQQIQAKLPSVEGCFGSTYPDTDWHNIPCHSPSESYPGSHRQQSPVSVVGIPSRVAPTIKSKGESSVIGYGGSGYTLVAPLSTLITQATVSFPSMTNVTAINDVALPFGGSLGRGLNNYTLQINSNEVPISKNTYCAASCKAWLQFIVTNAQYGVTAPYGFTDIYMQAWVITKDKKDCQTGWEWSTGPGGGSGCFKNYPNGANIHNPMSLADLKTLSMTASINSGMASLVVHIGTQSYAFNNTDLTSVGLGWTQYDFNLYGAGGSSFLILNRGAKVSINMAADYGSATPPTCLKGATTAESNNLIASSCSVLTTTPPSIQFDESVP